MLDDFGITPNGIQSKGDVRNNAVLIGDNFTCDGHFERPVRVVTHAHTDHIGGLKKSLKVCDEVIMTPTTKGLIETLYGEKLGSMEIVRTIERGEVFEYDGEKLTFYDANHIPGSAQVLVETESEERLLYTGDFKLPGAPIIPADLLITEATYGKPSQVRFFHDIIEKIFTNFVSEKLEEGPVNIHGYHGKIQEVLNILREARIDNPAIMPPQIYKATEVCEKDGRKYGRYLSIEEKAEVLKDNHIGLYHMNQESSSDGATKIKLSGWIFDEPIKKREDYYVVGLSDHCDFLRLMEYVRECDPKHVILDGSRGGGSKDFAKEIRKRLGKSAVSLG